MGHRANYLIKTDEGCELYYSHWGANVVERDLFWGPEESAAYIRTLKPTDQWLDDVWCEGGACLDFTEERLLFFGGEDAKYEPHLWTEIMRLYRLSWAPWSVEWAFQGIIDLARVAQVPDKTVLASGDDLSPDDGEKPAPVNKDYPWCSSTLTVDGKMFTYTNDIEHLLLNGPRLLRILGKQSPVVDAAPAGGAVIDTKERIINYWRFDAPPLLPEWLNQLWQGWKIQLTPELAIPQSEEFLQKIGLKPPSLQETQERIKQMLLAQVGSRALSLGNLKKLYGEDAEIELNPYATEDVRPQEDGEAHRAYLEQLLKSH